MKSYIEQYQILHKQDSTFGAGDQELFNEVYPFIKERKPKVIVDYGCGKGKLADRLNLISGIKCYKYDIGIEEYSKLEVSKADFVINTDVLEHIPEDELNGVLLKMSLLSDECYIRISCRKAAQILPNGQNAHCTIYPPRWWKKKLETYWRHVYEVEVEDVTSCAFVTFKPNVLRKIGKRFFRSVFFKYLIKVICAFVPKKSWRRELKSFYK